jgi:hypothetical protein
MHVLHFALISLSELFNSYLSAAADDEVNLDDLNGIEDQQTGDDNEGS